KKVRALLAASASCEAGGSGDLPTLSPPADKATCCQDQAGQASTGDGAGNEQSVGSGVHGQIKHRKVHDLGEATAELQRFKRKALRGTLEHHIDLRVSGGVRAFTDEGDAQ